MQKMSQPYKSVLRILAILALATGLVSTFTLTKTTPAQAAPSATKHTFSLTDVFPMKPLSQFAKPISAQLIAKAQADPSFLPPCLNNTVPPRCYSPQQQRNAYGIQPLFNAGITGKGHTIVLIESATSPYLQSDVHLYDQLFGLKDPTINVISPFAPPSVNPGPYQETALDVEEAHALAPDATIDLVLANADAVTSGQQFISTMLQVTQYAVQNNLGDVISQSFGVGESCAPDGYIQQEQQVFEEARAKGITVLASSGDSGAAILSCQATGNNIAFLKGVSLPAADPLVTAVGGTTLNATQKTGEYAGETVWNDGFAATGGGISTLFPVPSYQQNVTGLAKRGVPDVAFDADSQTGVPIVLSAGGGVHVTPFGGTSVGSPAWAAIVVLANQSVGHRLGFLNPSIYALAADFMGQAYAQSFHDIQHGNNTVTGVDFTGNPVPVPGYYAKLGWDAVTGAGSPIVSGLVTQLKK